MGDVLEIVSERQGTRGSGCLIASGLVLTAGHLAPGDACQVRHGSDGRAFAARRVWSGLDAGLDAALVEITDGEWPTGETPAARFGRLTTGHDEIPVDALGAPGRWLGSVPAGSRVHGRHYQAQVRGSEPAPGADGVGWRGIAGAALRFDAGQHGHLIVGVVSDVTAPEPAEQGRPGRLIAVPVWRLLKDQGFGRVVAERTGHKPYAEPVALAPLLTPPPSAPRSPAALLAAAARTVRWYGRHDELAELTRWCGGQALAVRLLSGPDGSGKTRLGLELVQALRASGWVGGFVADVEKFSRGFTPDAVAAVAPGVIVVVDDAEAQRASLRKLIDQLSGAVAVPVRLLLLTRSAGEWWHLLAAHARVEVSAQQLGPIRSGTTAPAAYVTAVAGDLAAALSRVPGYEQPGGVGGALAAEPYDESDPLTVQVDALAARLRPVGDEPAADVPERAPGLRLWPRRTQRAQDPTPPDSTAAAILLAHEEKLWRQDADGELGHLPPEALRQAVAAAALLGAKDRAEGQTVVGAVPSLRDQPDAVQQQVVDWLCRLYPGASPGGWRPLAPHRLAEHLIVADTRWLVGLLRRAAGDVSAGQARRMLAVLARAAERHAVLDTVIIETIRDWPRLAPAAVEVATWVDRPAPLLAGLGELLKTGRGLGLESLYGEVPRDSRVLGGWMTDLITRIVEQHAISPATPSPDLAEWLATRSDWHARTGRWDDAVTDAREAVAIRRSHAKTLQPGPVADLATSLSSLGARLADCGRWPEAAAEAREAAALRRGLAARDGFRSDLAGALHELSVLLGRLPQREAALAAADEAVVLYEEHVSGSPDDPPALVAALVNRSELLAASGRSEEALAVATVSVDRGRGAPESRGQRAGLAAALVNRGARLAEVGRSADALADVEEAVRLHRGLEAIWPDEFAPERAVALLSLAERLADPPDLPRAVRSAEEAVAIYRGLAAARPKVYASELVGSMAMCGWLLWRSVDPAQPAAADVVADAVAWLAAALATAEEHGLDALRNDVKDRLAEAYQARPDLVGEAWKQATGSEGVPPWMRGGS